MSKQTLEFHWGKHHRAYIDNLNKQIDGTDLERKNLEELVKLSYNNGNPQACFNNAGQAWNHDFFWSSIYPGGGGQPDDEVLELIERGFGSFEEFAKEFKAAGVSQFGSGWVWLILKDAKLSVLKTSNALNPLIWGYIVRKLFFVCCNFSRVPTLYNFCFVTSEGQSYLGFLCCEQNTTLTCVA
jgi:Fe-Mn family superoxide dismutase